MRPLPNIVPVLLLSAFCCSVAGSVLAQQPVSLETLNQQWAQGYLAEAAELEREGSRAVTWFVAILGFGWLISVFQIIMPFSARLDTKWVKILLAVFVATMTSLVAVKNQLSPIPAGIYTSAAREIRRNLKAYRSEAGNLYLVLKDELVVFRVKEHYALRQRFRDVIEKILTQVKAAKNQTIGTVALPSWGSVAYAQAAPVFPKVIVPPNTAEKVFAVGIGEDFTSATSRDAAMEAAREKLRIDVEDGFLAAIEACKECAIPVKFPVYFALRRDWLAGIAGGAKAGSRALKKNGEKFASHVVIELPTRAIIDSYQEILTLSTLGQKAGATGKQIKARAAAMSEYFQQ